MNEQDKEILADYLDESGRFRKEDHDRLARKAVLNLTGEHKNLEITTMASSIVVPGYQEQEKADKGRGGENSSSRRHGIWEAVRRARRNDPSISAKTLWRRLDGENVDKRWDISVCNDQIYQYDKETGKESSITFSTFRDRYFSKAK